MKIVIALTALLAIAYAAPKGADEPIPILSQDADVGVDGSFHSSFETGNGISAHEEGHLKNAGDKDKEALEVHGGFQYTAPDGTPIAVQYVADENGFHAEGDHLPVAPPAPEIPEAIQRSLKWNEEHPEPEQKSQGKH